MAAPVRVSIDRHGAALSVELDDGSRRLIRRVDLADELGQSGVGVARFTAPKVAGAGIEVELDDGARETVPVPEASGAADLVVRGACAAITCDGGETDPLGLLPGGAVICGGGKILWVGPEEELGRSGFDVAQASAVDAGGRLISPGLIDCHAHPIFGGDRAGEYAMRAAGRGYREIQEAGGGIRATVEPTRAASLEELVGLTYRRAARAHGWGTTTLEAKSGYDLTLEGELRMLEVAKVVDALSPVDLSPTLLGAHTLPPEYAEDRAGYVELCVRMAQEAADRDLAEAIDVYCDANAFTLEESRAILTAGRDAGLRVRGHVGQFADLGAPQLLAELGGLSGDHVEQISRDGIDAMARAGVVAVMLPGACVQLQLAAPPVELLRKAGVPLAVATDLNPGTSYSEALPIQMWLATTHYGMSVEEAWLGVTRIAARVLGRPDIGVLAPGARADLVLWDTEQPAEVPYHYGANLVHRVIKDGR